MSEWRITQDRDVWDRGVWSITEAETGRLIVWDGDGEVHMQIIREHNAHADLVNLAKIFRIVANDGKHSGMIKMIDVVLARVEGKEK